MLQILCRDHWWALKLNFNLKQCVKCFKLAECDE